MNLLMAYMDSSGSLTQLTLQEPLTFFLLGGLLVVLGLCSIFVPNGSVPAVVCCFLGVFCIEYSFVLHLYITNQEVKAIIVGIVLLILTIFIMVEFIKHLRINIFSYDR